jgi:hypothetical protein
MSVCFQRLERVRARQSFRRKRWARVLGALGVATSVVLSWLAVPMTATRIPLPPLVPSRLEHHLGFLSGGASMMGGGHGEADGRVEAVEPAPGIVRVSSGFLGLLSLELLVTPETLIVVGDKEGGFGDIRPGERVTATYEIRPGLWRAERIVVVGDGPPVASPRASR